MRGTPLWVATDAGVALYLFSCPRTSFVQHVVMHVEDALERGSRCLLSATHAVLGAHVDSKYAVH
jgi:hypothetical protein